MGILNHIKHNKAIRPELQKELNKDIIADIVLQDELKAIIGPSVLDQETQAITSIYKNISLNDATRHVTTYDTEAAKLEQIVNLNAINAASDEVFKTNHYKDSTYDVVFKKYKKDAEGNIVDADTSYANMKVGILSMASSIAYKTILQEANVNTIIDIDDYSADIEALPAGNAWETGFGSALEAVHEFPITYFHYKNEPAWTKSYMGIIAERFNTLANTTQVISKPITDYDTDNEEYTYSDEQMASIKQYASLVTDNEDKAQNVLSTLGILLKSTQETQNRLLKMEMSLFGEDFPTRPGLKPDLFGPTNADAPTSNIFNQKHTTLGLNRLIKALSNEVFKTYNPNFEDGTISYDPLLEDVDTEVDILRKAVFGINEPILLFTTKTLEEKTDIASKFPRELTPTYQGELPETIEIDGIHDSLNRLYEKVGTLTKFLNIEDNANQYPNILYYLLGSLLFNDTNQVSTIWELSDVNEINNYSSKLDYLEKFLLQYKHLANTSGKIANVPSAEDGTIKEINYENPAVTENDFTQYANIIDILVDTIGIQILPRMEAVVDDKDTTRGNKQLHTRIKSIETSLDELVKSFSKTYHEDLAFEDFIYSNELDTKIGSMGAFLELIANVFGFELETKPDGTFTYRAYNRQLAADGTEQIGIPNINYAEKENLFTGILDLLEIVGLQDRKRLGAIGDTGYYDVNEGIDTTLRGDIEHEGDSYTLGSSDGETDSTRKNVYYRELGTEIDNKELAEWKWNADSLVKMINSVKAYSESLSGNLQRINSDKLFRNTENFSLASTTSLVQSIIELKSFIHNITGISQDGSLDLNGDSWRDTTDRLKIFQDPSTGMQEASTDITNQFTIIDAIIRLKKNFDDIIGTELSGQISNNNTAPIKNYHNQAASNTVDTIANKMAMFENGVKVNNSSTVTETIINLKRYLDILLGTDIGGNNDDGYADTLVNNLNIFDAERANFNAEDITTAIHNLKEYLNTLVGTDEDGGTLVDDIDSWNDIFFNNTTDFNNIKEAYIYLKNYLNEKLGLSVEDSFSEIDITDHRHGENAVENLSNASFVLITNDIKQYFEKYLATIDSDLDGENGLDNLNFDDNRHNEAVANLITDLDALVDFSATGTLSIIDTINKIKLYFETFLGQFSNDLVTVKDGKTTTNLTLVAENVLGYIDSLKAYFEGFIGQFTETDNTNTLNGSAVTPTNETVLDYIRTIKNYIETGIGDLANLNTSYRTPTNESTTKAATTLVTAINDLKTHFENIIGTTDNGSISNLYNDIENAIGSNKNIIAAINKLYDFIGDIDGGGLDVSQTPGNGIDEDIRQSTLVETLNTISDALGDVTGNGTSILALDEQIRAGDLVSAINNISEIIGTYAGLGEIGLLANPTLTEAITNHESRIDHLENEEEDHESRITELETEIGDFGTIGNIGNIIPENLTISNALTNHETRIDTTEVEIDTLQTQVGNFEDIGEIGDIEPENLTISNALTNHESRIDTIETKIDNDRYVLGSLQQTTKYFGLDETYPVYRYTSNTNIVSKDIFTIDGTAATMGYLLEAKATSTSSAGIKKLTNVEVDMADSVNNFSITEIPGGMYILEFTLSTDPVYYGTSFNPDNVTVNTNIETIGYTSIPVYEDGLSAAQEIIGFGDIGDFTDEIPTATYNTTLNNNSDFILSSGTTATPQIQLAPTVQGSISVTTNISSTIEVENSGQTSLSRTINIKTPLVKTTNLTLTEQGSYLSYSYNQTPSYASRLTDISCTTTPLNSVNLKATLDGSNIEFTHDSVPFGSYAQILNVNLTVGHYDLRTDSTNMNPFTQNNAITGFSIPENPYIAQTIDDYDITDSENTITVTKISNIAENKNYETTVTLTNIFLDRENSDISSQVPSSFGMSEASNVRINIKPTNESLNIFGEPSLIKTLDRTEIRYYTIGYNSSDITAKLNPEGNQIIITDNRSLNDNNLPIGSATVDEKPVTIVNNTIDIASMIKDTGVYKLYISSSELTITENDTLAIDIPIAP